MRFEAPNLASGTRGEMASPAGAGRVANHCVAQFDFVFSKG